MRRKILAGGMVLALGAFLLLGTISAQAIVHPFTPSNECSDGNGGGVQALLNGGIGDGNPGGVGPPVPLNNPGESSPDLVGVPAACE